MVFFPRLIASLKNILLSNRMISSVLELSNNNLMKGMSLYLLQIVTRSSVSCKIYWTNTLPFKKGEKDEI